MTMTRQRHFALTIGTGVITAITAITLFGAPPIPVGIGALIAIILLLRRAPEA